jgi:hypothetical protein
MKSPKTLEFISGALELQSTHGRAVSQATGVKLTYMWHLGTAQFFDAVKVSYYGGCGKHSFEIPVFFDYSPLYLLSPENALTGIIAPFLLQIGFNQLLSSWRRYDDQYGNCHNGQFQKEKILVYPADAICRGLNFKKRRLDIAW